MSTRSNKSVSEDMAQVHLATELINLGARMPILEEHTSISRERLIKLYRELRNQSPAKGMLPYAPDWFLTWQPNIHGSVFMGLYDFLMKNTGVSKIRAIIEAYKIYLENFEPVEIDGKTEPVLSLMRAWTLIRFVESKMIKSISCSCCDNRFLVNSLDLHTEFMCGICKIPSRAGKKKSKKMEFKLPLAA